MPMQWIDVTIPLHPGMTVWPGDPPFQLTPKNRIAQGDGNNTSLLTLSTHTGTHVDAPWHFEEDGKRLDEVDTAVFFGDALVLDLPEVKVVTAADLPEEPLPDRVLFKTANSDYPADAPFNAEYAALDASVAQRLADDGVVLVGVDALSVAPRKQPGQVTHHVLLHKGVVVVEGLRLQRIAPGMHPFVVLPLALRGADGAPCRAFVGVDEP